MAANDLLDRYLYAVSRYLPAHRQADLLAELSANLHAEREDRETELGRSLTEEEQADLLRRHGHPVLVAARYQPQRSLIGPEVFPFYLFAIRRILPWVVGIWLLAAVVTTIFGLPDMEAARHVDIGHIIDGLFGVIFQFLAWITIAFAFVEFFKSYFFNAIHSQQWDPRKLPKADPIVDQNGPHHPYADAIASAAFLAWLLLFPHYPVLMFGPYVAMRVLNLNIDLPAVWHTFYWIIIVFNAIQLAFRIALLSRPMRRYYHIFESVLHLFGIGIIAFLLRAHDYVGEATFGGSTMPPATVSTVNANIHRGLLLVLIIAIAKFVWDTSQWLRPKTTPPIANKMGAPS